MLDNWYSSKKIQKANAFPDADLVGLRDRGDVVSPKVLRYEP
jgi:hypothetical protein